MGKLIDLTGQKLGRLTVIKRVENSKQKNAMWECICDCGNRTICKGNDLRIGHTQSCGCLKKEKASEIGKILGKSVVTHGMTNSRLYSAWHSMKVRCTNPNTQNYKNYGGRGIAVCDEWLDSFESFRDWAMANGYRDDLTIDRINNDGPYSPENCRWVTKKEQGSNRRSNHFITHNGETHTLKQWAEKKGISRETLNSRLFSLGWSVERALSEPVRREFASKTKQKKSSKTE
jgi:hypothetical protein